MKPVKAKSIRALAKAVDRSHTAVAGWVKRDDWTLGVKPPWDVAKVKAWMTRLEAEPGSEDGGTPADDGKPMSRERREKLRLIRARRLTIQFDQAVKEKKYVLREEAEREWTEVARMIRTEFVNLSECGVVTAIRQATTEHEAKAILQGRVFEILSRLSGDGGK